MSGENETKLESEADQRLKLIMSANPSPADVLASVVMFVNHCTSKGWPTPHPEAFRLLIALDNETKENLENWARQASERWPAIQSELAGMLGRQQ